MRESAGDGAAMSRSPQEEGSEEKPKPVAGGVRAPVGGSGLCAVPPGAPHPPLLGSLLRSCDSDSAAQAPAKTCFFGEFLHIPLLKRFSPKQGCAACAALPPPPLVSGVNQGWGCRGGRRAGAPPGSVTQAAPCQRQSGTLACPRHPLHFFGWFFAQHQNLLSPAGTQEPQVPWLDQDPRLCPCPAAGSGTLGGAAGALHRPSFGWFDANSLALAVSTCFYEMHHAGWWLRAPQLRPSGGEGGWSPGGHHRQQDEDVPVPGAAALTRNAQWRRPSELAGITGGHGARVCARTGHPQTPGFSSVGSR